MSNSRKITKCQICKSSKLERIINLGFIAPVNDMKGINDKSTEQITFPLELYRCAQCHHVQIDTLVNSNILFPFSYPYVTGNTKILIKNFFNLFQQCKRLLSISKDDLIVDIGSNDGSLLKNFKDYGMKTLGIEPSKASQISKKNKIPTLVKYFNNETVEFVKKKYGKAKLITATNVFAHIEDPNKLVSLVKKLMGRKSIFVTESHYLVSLLKTLQYDTVYHEHLRYYHVNALKVLFEKNNMEIINVKKINTHGGSIRVFASKKGEFTIDKSVNNIIKSEQKYGLSDFNIFQDFKRKVVISKFFLLKMIADLKLKGNKIYGVGSPSRASTLINFVGLDENFIDYILEVKHSSKINKFMPGTRIPVVDENIINKDSPDYLLILSWHIADELIQTFKKKGYTGKFILPLPKPSIVS